MDKYHGKGILYYESGYLTFLMTLEYRNTLDLEKRKEQLSDKDILFLKDCYCRKKKEYDGEWVNGEKSN